MTPHILMRTTATLALLVSAQAAFAGSSLKLDITNATHHVIAVKQFNSGTETATVTLKNFIGTAADKVKATVEQNAKKDNFTEATIEVEAAGAGSEATIKQQAQDKDLGLASAEIKIDGGAKNRVEILQQDFTGSVTATAYIVKGNAENGTGGTAEDNSIEITQYRSGFGMRGVSKDPTKAYTGITNSSRSSIDVTQQNTLGAYTYAFIRDSRGVAINARQDKADVSYLTINLSDSDWGGIYGEQTASGFQFANIIGRDLTLGTNIKLFQQSDGPEAEIEVSDAGASKYDFYQYGGNSQIQVTVTNEHRTTANIWQSGDVKTELTATNTQDGSIEIYQESMPVGFEINF